MTKTVSEDVLKKVADYEQADMKFKTAWDAFEQQNAGIIAALEKLREERNAKLDDATRALRTEAQEMNITEIKRVAVGPFVAQKKWSSFYVAEKLVPMLLSKKLYEHAVNAKIVAEKVDVAKYDEVKAFLKAHGVETEFEVCEDGNELTPSITGPKSIPSFGTEKK